MSQRIGHAVSSDMSGNAKAYLQIFFEPLKQIFISLSP